MTATARRRILREQHLVLLAAVRSELARKPYIAEVGMTVNGLWLALGAHAMGMRDAMPANTTLSGWAARLVEHDLLRREKRGTWWVYFPTEHTTTKEDIHT